MGVTSRMAGLDSILPHMLDAAPSELRPPTILLNSNESAFGPSPLAREAARAAAKDIERYLEFPERLLAPAIAARYGLDPGRIAVGVGADDLLARIARAYLGPGDELIRSANGYLKVPNYAHANGAVPVGVPDEGFVPSVDNMIAALTERTRMVYIANPENPAGTMLPGAELRRLHAALPDNVLLVLDCAYEDYVDAPGHEPGHRLVEDFDNVVMCRTFSKIHGLAGARVGWAYGPAPVIDVLRRIGLTFPLARSSALAAVAALSHRQHTEWVREANAAGRDRLAGRLAEMGLSVVPSHTNFVLVHLPDPERSAAALDAWLLARGIAIRRFSAPAYRDHVRITVGLPDEVEACLDGIAAFLEAPR